MSKEKSTYKNILKATSILGGVQFYSIIINVMRSKVVAVLLGPTGFGILSLFTNTIGIVSQIVSFGIGTVAVKDVAVACNESPNKLNEVYSIVRKLVISTGILGLILTLCLGPILSKITFGNFTYTVSFMVLSICVLLGQLTIGGNVVLQGTSNVKQLAKSNAVGATIGLVISVPFYYFMGIEGIVPAMVFSALFLTVCVLYFTRKTGVQSVFVDQHICKEKSRDILKLGFIVSISSTITLVVAQIVRIFIGHYGGLSDVGFYTAGFAIINTYVGMVFTAMSSEYYPRLSIDAFDVEKSNKTINNQIEITILILGPILILLLAFINVGVQILYSVEFLIAVPMVQYATLGVFFKGLGWPIAFLFLARSDSKMFFYNEVLANVYILVFNILGYYYYGLNGLGVSFFLSYLVYFIQIIWITKIKYGFMLENSIIKFFSIQFVLGILCLINLQAFEGVLKNFIAIIFVCLSAFLSFYVLNKKLNLLKFLK